MRGRGVASETVGELSRRPGFKHGVLCVGDLVDEGVPYNVIYGIVQAQSWEVEDLYFGDTSPYVDNDGD